MSDNARPAFTFETQSVSTFRVYAFSGTEEVHRPYEYEIELVHEASNVDFAGLLGQTACLSVADKSGGVRHVHGVIRDFRQLHTANARTHYRCTLVPRLWFLGQATDHRIFQNLTVLQIIEQVLKEQNFTEDSYAFKCFFDYEPREYCVQYGETSLHFISRLCEEEGVYFYFEHAEDRHVLCFSDREGGPFIDGESELRFHPGAGTETDTATIRDARLSRGIGSDAVTFREWNFERTRLNLEVGQTETDATKAPVPVGMTLEQYRYPHLYQLRKTGTRYAGIELLRQQSLSLRIDARTDVSRMAPGFTFTMHGHHRPDLNARWWIVRVEQRGEQPQVLEHEAPDRGMTYAAKVVAIPNTTRFVPASDHPKNRVIGDQTALVTGPDGEEIFPDQYGRVKVQFHWDRLGAYDENTTCWIRVSQGWAGGHYGTLAIPRIGHEVIVSFQNGDPDRPIITGRVYNSANPVPYPLPAHKTRTVFKSLSSPGGQGFNEFRVEDRRNQEEIYIHAEKDVNVYVKNDWKEHILHDQHRTVDNFSYSLVKGEDQQTVNRDRKVELLSGDHLTVKNCSHSHFADKWLLRTGEEAHIKAGSKATLEAGTELTVKAGGSFIRLDPAGVTIVGAKVGINSGGSPGSGSGARPLLPVDSLLPEEGQMPVCQKVTFNEARVLNQPFIKKCPVALESGNEVRTGSSNLSAKSCKCSGSEVSHILGISDIRSYTGDFPSPFQILRYVPEEKEFNKYFYPDKEIRTWIKDAAEYHGIPHVMLAIILQQENAPSASKFRQFLQYSERTITTGMAIADKIFGDLIPDKIPRWSPILSGVNIAGGSSGFANMSRRTLESAASYIEKYYCKNPLPTDVRFRVFEIDTDIRIPGYDWKSDLYYCAAHIRQLIDRITGNICHNSVLTLKQVEAVFAAYNGLGEAAQKYGSDALDMLCKSKSGETILYFYEK